MVVLVVGANGATGRHLVQQLLLRGNKVKAIVRSKEKLPNTWRNRDNLEIIVASIIDLSDDALLEYVSKCDAIVSCLGHNVSLKGIYGKPRRLVTEATKRLCVSIKTCKPNRPIKFVLMNSSGCSNKDLHEPISFAQKCVIALLRFILPPHVDNEKAANYLRTEIGQNNEDIEWVAVRPDSLINEEEVTAYTTFPSPVRSAIFNAGKISRINVGHFMSELINDDNLWIKWKGKMPVIYANSSMYKTT